MSKWLSWQQELGVIFFISSVCIVFSWSAGLLLRMAISRLRKKEFKAFTVTEKVVLGLAGFGIICISYGYFIEPYWLDVTHITLSTSKLASGEHFRIVQISDLHCDPKPRLEKKLPSVIELEKPDLIAFTGDALNSPGGLPIFRNCLSKLAKIAPTYVVKGNWDAWYFTDLDRFGGTGATELNGALPVAIRGESGTGSKVWIAGSPVPGRNSPPVKVSVVDQVMKDVPEKAFRIFLFHYPDLIESAQRNKVDLYLAGHTHGGQVALPLYGAILTLSAYGKEFEAGLYKRGDTHMYVNRGIGMEGGNAPRVRFCARPEVTVIDVLGEG